MTALTLFHDLCAVGNALAQYRDTHAPCSDGWTTLTCIIVSLDATIDRLVHSSGLACDDGEDAPLGEAPPQCPSCHVAGCAGTCLEAHLDASARTFPGVQAQAARLYAAYVAGLGPLGTALPPWDGLIERQQYVWRCVARAGEDEA